MRGNSAKGRSNASPATSAANLAVAGARLGNARANAKRELIVAKAAELFDRHGYHQVNITQIARAAGIEKPTLYHYFKSKHEILYWIHDIFIDLLLEKQADRPEGLRPTEALTEVMCDVIDLMQTHRSHVRVFFEHHRELSSPAKATVRAKRHAYQSYVESIVEAGISSAEFRAVDPALTTLAVFGMCNWAYTWFPRDGSMKSRNVGEFLAGLLLRGLANQAGVRANDGEPATI
jgi:AcrR family transcriptional regulator